MFSIKPRSRCLPLAVLLAACTTAQAADTVIVYDASNSMWGQIDGEAKITIARRVLGGIIEDWDESEPLGLVAYGHRRTGDCSDIETVVPVGPLDRDALLAEIEAISPKGKTPLTEAVRHAAEELNYRDAPANVVLISDGIESCNADPCAAAAELDRAGINFTAHVIGFDIDEAGEKQLRCIAENTGGRFFAARNADGLQTALGEAARIATEEIPEAEVTIEAPATTVAGSRVEVRWHGEKIQPRDLVTIVPAGSDPAARTDYERVGDRDTATLLAPGKPGAYEARYVSSATGRAVARAPIELTAPQVTLSAPESVAGGARFGVEWDGAVHPRDYVTIVPAGAPDDAYGDYIRVGGAGTGSLQAPVEPGDYEVRYLLTAGDRAVARTPIEVVEKAVSVRAPGSVTAGAQFAVEWTDAVHPRDYVTVVPAGAPADAYGDYIRVGDARDGTLRAPAEPGDYEVRYLLVESDRAVAAAPLQVTAPETAVSGPESAVAGSRITVSWTNTIHHRDYVTVVPAEAPPDAYGDYKRVGGENKATLRVPGQAGQYEIRYLLDENDRPLAAAPLQVTAPETVVSGPESAVAGSRITVSWTNTIHHRDYVTIVPADAPPDAYGDYKRVGGGTDAQLQVPAEPGAYEIRYLLDVSDRPIARAPIALTTPEASVSAPEAVAAGSRFEVRWTGTVHPRDKVTIVPAVSDDDAYGDYLRVGSATSGHLKAPDSPGDYEVRYLLDVNGSAIARTPVRVE